MRRLTPLWVAAILTAFLVGSPNTGVVAAKSAVRLTAPYGNLDGVDPIIGGWTCDLDNQSSLMIHIYIDNKFAHAMLANENRPDVVSLCGNANHGFSWIPPPQGDGTHSVAVYAVGIDASANPDSSNNSWGGTIDSTGSNRCAGMSAVTAAWCTAWYDRYGQYGAYYYQSRASDTEYLYSGDVRVGMNASFGGAIFEFYGPDHNVNLVAEHGGAGLQPGTWGYDPNTDGSSGHLKWFRESPFWNTTAYSSQSDCKDHDTNRSPVDYPCGGHALPDNGFHVADGTNVIPCSGTSVAWPINPIPAYAHGCEWYGSSNDASVSWSGGAVTLTKTNPGQFSKSSSFPDLTFGETASLVPGGFKMDYQITYSGSTTLSEHPQESPAFFTAAGVNYQYWYANANGVTHRNVADSATNSLGVSGRTPFDTPLDTLAEPWVSLCDANAVRCVTMVPVSSHMVEIGIGAYSNGINGYFTPANRYNVQQGLNEQFTVYFFPYRYDYSTNGKTIREWVTQNYAPNWPN